MTETHSVGHNFYVTSPRKVGSSRRLTTIGIIWDPVFDTLGATAAQNVSNGTTVAWSKRCYMLNLNHLTLRPIQDNDMIARKPPRNHDSYNYYWGMTWRGALTSNRMNCHGVITATGG